MGGFIDVLPLNAETQDAGEFLGGSLPTTDPGINVVGSTSALSALTGLANSLGSTIAGVINTGTIANEQTTLAQTRAQSLVSGGFGGISLGTILLIGVGFLAYRRLTKK